MFFELEGVAHIQGTAVLHLVGAEPELRRMPCMKPVEKDACGPAIGHAGNDGIDGVRERFGLRFAPHVQRGHFVGKNDLPVCGDDERVAGRCALVVV